MNYSRPLAGLPDPVIAAVKRVRPMIDRATFPDATLRTLDQAGLDDYRADLERRVAWDLGALVSLDLAVERRDAVKAGA